MAQSSSQILEQITKQYGNPSDASNIIESTIRDAYAPSVKNLIQEGNTLRGEYYPAFFNEAQKLGTTAADMSPAARLAAMQQAGESAGQLYRTNLGLRDYYKTDINSMIDRAMQMYNAGYGSLKDMYSMALSGEQARTANAANQAIIDYYKNQPKPGATEPIDPNTVPDVVTLDDVGRALINQVGAKTVSPIRNAQGFVIAYNMKLPNGRMIQGALPESDLANYQPYIPKNNTPAEYNYGQGTPINKAVGISPLFNGLLPVQGIQNTFGVLSKYNPEYKIDWSK